MSTQVTELAIVKRIMTKLQLGDAGKLGAFFSKQVKNSQKEIRDLERNKVTLKNEYNDSLEDLKDQIEDATEALVDAYDNVTPDDVKNNKAMAEFEEIYWAGVKSAQRKLENLKEQMKREKEEYKDEVKEIDEEITLHKARIEALQGK